MNPLKVYYVPDQKKRFMCKRTTGFVVLFFLLLLFTIFEAEQILYHHHQHISHIEYSPTKCSPSYTQIVCILFRFPLHIEFEPHHEQNNCICAQRYNQSLFVFFYRIDVVDKKKLVMEKIWNFIT